MSFLYQIDDILTKDECDSYIKKLEKSDNIESINEKHRKYHRIKFYDEELASKLFEHIQPYLSNKIKKIAIGMNPTFRISKYFPGQFFGIHKDGINYDENDKSIMSYATLNIFLNEDFSGGETVFYDNDKKTVTLLCKPKIGRASFFYSQQFHAGNIVENGNKYLLRTDLFVNHNK